MSQIAPGRTVRPDAMTAHVYWHEPSVPGTARAGPEVGVERPMLPAGHRLSAMEGRPSVAGKPSSRQPVTHYRP
jgi:hypothetical protein